MAGARERDLALGKGPASNLGKAPLTIGQGLARTKFAHAPFSTFADDGSQTLCCGVWSLLALHALQRSYSCHEAGRFSGLADHQATQSFGTSLPAILRELMSA